MDSSAFRYLPVGPILWIAVVGAIVIAINIVAALAFLAWWVVNHVQII